VLDLIALLITLTAVLAWVNQRFVRLPTTIGVMGIALLFSLGLVSLGEIGFPHLEERAEAAVRSIDFSLVLMHGMLSLLLFAGALHVDLEELASRKWPIGVLATVGVVLSTLLIATGSRLVFDLVGIEMAWIHCLLFGALVSPTDPIAVMGILKSAKAPKGLEIKITGESLFNDGVAVVVFAVLLKVAAGGEALGATQVALLFLEEAVGGVVFGLVIGYVAYQMLRSIDNYQVEVIITLALVLGGFALATHLHVSGPLAMVAAGLLIGNRGRVLAMSDRTRQNLDTFWELIDEILNAVLFLMIGIELVVLTFSRASLLAALLMIPLALAARFVAVGVPVGLMRRFHAFPPHAVKILTWGGVRGGISVALALSLPSGPERQVLLAITYVVVLASILVQGLTLGVVVRRLTGSVPATATS
jgi:CPA1 family monovalent cation:H+ antiporter